MRMGFGTAHRVTQPFFFVRVRLRFVYKRHFPCRLLDEDDHAACPTCLPGFTRARGTGRCPGGADQRVDRGRASQRIEHGDSHQRRRPLCRLRVHGDEPRRCRRERGLGHLPARPRHRRRRHVRRGRRRGDDADQPRLRRRGEWPEHAAGDLRRRTLRGVRLDRRQSRRRPQRRAAGLPRRPHERRRRPDQRERRGRRRRSGVQRAGHQRHRRRHRVHVDRHQSGGRRCDRRARTSFCAR